MFKGLSAFPITPFRDEKIDFRVFGSLISNLVEAKVDSICVCGSTGLYPYLKRQELTDLTRSAAEIALDIPIMVGIGSLRTYDVLKNAEAAQKASADAVLLAPVSYHKLNDNEVYGLFKKVASELSVPLCVYENPGTTNFNFSNELYKEICRLPSVSAIKIPGVVFESEESTANLTKLRKNLPEHIAIGVSGDKYASAGMAAGCDLWFSVIGGLFPKTVQTIINASKKQSRNEAMLSSLRYDDLWKLYNRNRGGLRVMAAAAEILGFAEKDCLPEPLLPITGDDRKQLETFLNKWQFS